MTSLHHAIAFLISLFAAVQAGLGSILAEHSVWEYRGTCDASAAASIGNDYFVVANDEDNILYVYRFGVHDPVASYDLDSFAKADPDKPEMDIEAAAKIGNRIYWLTSHGANRNGKYRQGRRRFFATDFSFVNGRPIVTPVGQAYTALLDDLDAAPELKKYHLAEAAELAPKAEGGLNIEGLASTPEGSLLIGFRNPIPNGQALIVTIRNPGDVIQGQKPQIGPVYELPLRGLGIRAFERRGQGYLIVAGPHDGKGKFRLFRWRGPMAETMPTLVRGVKFKKFHAEALFDFANGRVYVLSDDGTRDMDGVKCKELPAEEKRFRGVPISP